MKLAILGRGNMGGPLAELGRKAGYDVSVVGRDGDAAAAITAADLIVLALHYDPAKALLSEKAVRAALDGKVLIDVTNPLAPESPCLPPDP